jgi:hypothetical protein
MDNVVKCQLEEGGLLNRQEYNLNKIFAVVHLGRLEEAGGKIFLTIALVQVINSVTMGRGEYQKLFVIARRHFYRNI